MHDCASSSRAQHHWQLSALHISRCASLLPHTQLTTSSLHLNRRRDPVVFACANPTPEIDPDLARATREDVIVCTGRSDFPNQINNVCAFPYIFRGALDCRAKWVAAMGLAAGHLYCRVGRPLCGAASIA